MYVGMFIDCQDPRFSQTTVELPVLISTVMYYFMYYYISQLALL